MSKPFLLGIALFSLLCAAGLAADGIPPQPSDTTTIEAPSDSTADAVTAETSTDSTSLNPSSATTDTTTTATSTTATSTTDSSTMAATATSPTSTSTTASSTPAVAAPKDATTTTGQASGTTSTSTPSPASTETSPATDTTASASTAATTDAATTSSGQTAPATTTASTAQAPSDLATALAQIDELNARIAELSTKLDAAEKDLATTESDLSTERDARTKEAEAAAQIQKQLSGTADEATAEVKDLQAKLAERDKMADNLASLEEEKARLSGALEAERSGRFQLADWPKVLLSGFDGAKPRIGKWKLSETSAAQTDPRQFFSRLDFPLEQGKNPYLYRFDASSTGDGWVGLGIHFFASGVKSKHGYGEGRSLLVWLTRDPAVRKTNATWLQLYRSDNDVVMERVLDSKLEEAIKDKLSIEAAYDPESGYVTVSIDGKLAVKYRAWFGIDEGVGVSLRTLGAGVSFSNFEVRTKD